MTPAQWLLLDNLCNRWPAGANMTQTDAEKALRWAENHGYVAEGRITDRGRGYFLLYGNEKPKD